MAFAAGETITAAKLNRIQPVTYAADCTGTYAITTTVATITGVSITFNTTTDNALYAATGFADITQLATTNNDAFVWLGVDGVDSADSAPFGGQVSGDRDTVAKVWRGTLGTAGSHTLTLRASATANSQYQANTNSGLHVVIYEVV